LTSSTTGYLRIENLDYKSYINKYSIGHDWLAEIALLLATNGIYLSRKLPEEKAKQLLRAHVGGPENCTTEHIKLVKFRA
jgi:hypothetical protein